MENVPDREEAQWHVMRAYKSEKTAEEMLSDAEYGMRHFIPKHKVLRTVNGRKVLYEVPVIHSLVFVYATHQQIVDFKRNRYNGLQFVTRRDEGRNICLTVPGKQMDSFITVCEQKEKEVHFYTPDDILKEGMPNIGKGRRVRVHGGVFDQVEGYFVKVARRRGRQLVVIIPDLLVVTAEVSPDYIQVLE
ncbi:MAG: UpxY family transcription antiterminator [Prevotella sp.]